MDALELEEGYRKIGGIKSQGRPAVLKRSNYLRCR